MADNKPQWTELDGQVGRLRDVVVPKKFYERVKTSIRLIDEIFGGPDTPGLLKGESVLFTGNPGAGKSTMSYQLADLLQRVSEREVLYNIGEESKVMVKMACDRIGIQQDFTVGQLETVDKVMNFCKEKGVEVLFQDSLQSLAGSGHARLLETTMKLHKFAHDEDITVIMMGHVTKSGAFAGPQALEHIVDARAHLRRMDDAARVFTMTKNRFGPAGIPFEFTLTSTGLDFRLLPQDDSFRPEEGQKGGPRASRTTQIVNLIRERLLAGDEISGYCAERYSVDCSGGLWRVLVERAAEQLRREGHDVDTKIVNRRTHAYVKQKREDE